MKTESALDVLRSFEPCEQPPGCGRFETNERSERLMERPSGRGIILAADTYPGTVSVAE